jgi:hypothetical protein
MRTQKQLHAALNVKGFNVAQFCATHKLPLRTVMRVKAGGTPRNGTWMLIDLALSKAQE